MTLPSNTAFQYKYVKKDPDGTVKGESGANRSASTGSGVTLTVNDGWQ